MPILGEISGAFARGGWLVMSCISGVLLVSLGIMIYRFLKISQYSISNSSAFMVAIQKMIMNNSIENAIRLCKKTKPKLLPDILAEGLKRANESPEEVANALDHALLKNMPKVTGATPFLATTANVATLFGLLGTLFGLMKSFGALANASGDQKSAILAHGISEALTATSFGLGTALFCMLGFGVLNLMQKSLADDIQQNTAKLTDLLYTRSVKIKAD